MSAALHNAADAFLARYRGLRERLPGDIATRDAAAEVFAVQGLPDVREEAWKYTSLRALAETDFHEPLQTISDRAAPPALLPEIPVARLIFIDGRYSSSLSVPPHALDFQQFAHTPEFGLLPGAGAARLVALNTMLAEDGAFLTVPAGRDAGLLALVSIGAESHGRKPDFHPRHRLHLQAGARLTLLEFCTGTGSYFHNPVYDIRLEHGARLDHVRIQREDSAAFHLASLMLDVGAGAQYRGVLLHAGARSARSEIQGEISGEGGQIELFAAQLLRGAALGDITVTLRHSAPGGISRQEVRSVIADTSRGVFQGRVEVARGARRSDARQLSQALLLSEQAEIDTKPELEIYDDDVKCSHGATVGTLDEDQLFYLRARGIQEEEARAILVRAFLTTLADAVDHPLARRFLEAEMEKCWNAPDMNTPA